jgi:hypothetical protein
MMQDSINTEEKSIMMGKFWAAIQDERVVSLISMSCPKSEDFDCHRNKCIEKLQALGSVKSGELIKRNNNRYFVQRLTHANRGKKPRQVKEYMISSDVFNV